MDSKDFVLRRTAIILNLQDRRESLRRNIAQNREEGFFGIPIPGWLQLLLGSGSSLGSGHWLSRFASYGVLPLVWKVVQNRFNPPKSRLLSRLFSLFSI